MLVGSPQTQTQSLQTANRLEASTDRLHIDGHTRECEGPSPQAPHRPSPSGASLGS